MANSSQNDPQSPSGQETDVDVDAHNVQTDTEISPVTKELSQKEETWLKPLRTYKYDVAEALKKGSGSLTRIVLAQKKKEREAKERASQKTSAGKGRAVESGGAEKEQRTILQKNIVLIAVSTLILIAGIGVTYGAIVLLTREKSQSPLSLSEEIIITDSQKQVALADLSENEVRIAVNNEFREPLSAGHIKGVYLIKQLLSSGTQEVGERPSVGLIGVRELFFILKNRMPPELLRSFNDQEFLFGLHRFRENNPFLILKTGSFENTFSGMLKWERFMFDDLSVLFALDTGIRGRLQSNFEDKVLENRDVRMLTDVGENTVLLYAFVDRETLVIATNKTTFNEVVTRLKAPKKIIR